MKNIASVIFMFLIGLAITNTIIAQPAQGNVFVVTNFERAFVENGSANELDSLNQIFMDNSFKGNQYVVSYKTLRHWWGHDNTDFIQVFEVKSWEDVDKASETANELFKKAMPNKDDRIKFNKAYNKYFTGKHSDEIYREVVFKK